MTAFSLELNSFPGSKLPYLCCHFLIVAFLGDMAHATFWSCMCYVVVMRCKRWTAKWEVNGMPITLSPGTEHPSRLFLLLLFVLLLLLLLLLSYYFAPLTLSPKMLSLIIPSHLSPLPASLPLGSLLVVKITSYIYQQRNDVPMKMHGKKGRNGIRRHPAWGSKSAKFF